MAHTMAEVSAWYQRAKDRRVNFDSLYRDVYRLAIPYRDMMDSKTEGQDSTAEIYDSTAVDSTNNFANFIHEGFTPPEFRWMKYSTGPDIEESMRERVQTLLDGVTEIFFHLLWSTNFDTEINQCYRDLAAGTGVLGIRDYGKFGDHEAPATFVATPPYEVYTLDGREGDSNFVSRRFELEPHRVKMLWKDADFDETEWKKGKSTQSDTKIVIIEACFYDYEDQTYYYYVFQEGEKQKFILKDENKSASWIVFRWSVVSGEMHGRGPLINALADIKTANKVVELILKNASIELSGIYTAVDDGVLNVNNVELVPGTIIPVQSNGTQGNGRSLDLLPRGGNFDVSELVLRDLRQSIRRKLMDDDLAPLDDAVRSSAETTMRFAAANKKAGPSMGRIRTELGVKLIKELTTMWQAKGLLPPFQIDGKAITIRFTSPLAQIQNDDDLKRTDMYIARMNTLMPNSAPVVVKPEEYAHYVAEKTGIPMKLINSKEMLVQAQQVMGQKIAQGGPEAEQIVEGFQQ